MWMWQETLLQNFVKLEVNLTFFAPWLPWQRPPFWICSTPQQLPHTTVDIPTKFHEVWWKESKIILNPLFLFPWQLRQSLSNLLWLFLCFSIFKHFGRFHGNGSHFEKINPYQHNFTWHMIFLQGFIKFDQGISKKSSGQKCVEE